MQLKKKSITLFLALAFVVSGMAQGLKIGYANIELTLAYMPESKTMAQQLQTYEQKLAEKIQTKQQYAQSKLEEYQAFAQQVPPPDEASIKSRQDELLKLDQEIQQDQANAQQKLIEKQQELMEPIIEKLQSHLDALAEAEGYDMILNTVDAGGVSIVLYGPPDHDLTEKLMTRLGIEIPEAPTDGK